LIWKINGIIFSDGSTKIMQKGTFYKGWSLDREKFDNWLLERARSANSKLMMNSRLIELKFSDKYHVKEAIIQNDKKKVTINPNHVIAADGAESIVAKILGVEKNQPNLLANVYSWEMKNLKINNPHFEQFYFGKYAPRAYAYLFPKSKNTANIGVGSTKGDKHLVDYFENFVNEAISSQTKGAIKTIERTGKAPAYNITSKLRYGNVIFTGDSANQNFKPYFEGILPSIICGDIAGKVCSSNNKISYKNSIEKKLGNQFKKSEDIFTKFYEIDKFEDKKDLLNLYLFAFLNTEEIDELLDKDITSIKNELIRKSSSINRFITMLRYFIWYSKILATRCD
jgi:digeranylgeranylglycerophospholipid reductase